ncbi:MAG: restriction endonuclease [Ardenticatenales bacterium]|nr:restriction endonuclease [Ardenticatenales bacterium]
MGDGEFHLSDDERAQLLPSGGQTVQANRLGASQGQLARKGIFITTSTFTKDALDFAAAIESKLILMDGEDLAGHMIDHGVGVSHVALYAVKRIDSDYFVQE